MFSFIPTWLPTKDDQYQSQADELARIDREYLPTMQKMMTHSQLADESLSKLVETLTEEQYQFYLQNKTEAQKAGFHKGLLDHYDRRRREIPVERYEIENNVQVFSRGL